MGRGDRGNDRRLTIVKCRCGNAEGYEKETEARELMEGPETIQTSRVIGTLVDLATYFVRAGS